jgi:hypothetical protein
VEIEKEGKVFSSSWERLSKQSHSCSHTRQEMQGQPFIIESRCQEFGCLGLNLQPRPSKTGCYFNKEDVDVCKGTSVPEYPAFSSNKTEERLSLWLARPDHLLSRSRTFSQLHRVFSFSFGFWKTYSLSALPPFLIGLHS